MLQLPMALFSGTQHNRLMIPWNPEGHKKGRDHWVPRQNLPVVSLHRVPGIGGLLLPSVSIRHCHLAQVLVPHSPLEGLVHSLHKPSLC